MSFDPQLFLNTGADAAGATRVDPIPQGSYRAIVSDVVARMVAGKAGETPVLDVTFELDAPDVAAKLNRAKLTSRASYWLDLTDGKLGTGPNQNVKLNRLRELVGQNKPGVPLGALKGAGPVQVFINHRQDRDDPSIIYDEVKSVAAVG